MTNETKGDKGVNEEKGEKEGRTKGRRKGVERGGG
jgi:hypothetical protein